MLERLRLRRDVVLVDQRGTGRSAPLVCPDDASNRSFAAWEVAAQRQAMAACRKALQKLSYIAQPTDLAFFTTPLAMQDLDAVRQRVGADQINVVGVSYGTRAALDYQRQFGAHVRRSVLDGVAPPDMALPASSAQDSQAALDALWADCAAESECKQAFPSLRGDWQKLLQSLPRRTTVADPLSGQPQTEVLSRAALLGVVRSALYVPSLASALPQAVHDAAQGRLEGLSGLGSALRAPGAAPMAMGMHLSVLCGEDMPLLNAPPRNDERQGQANRQRHAERSGERNLERKLERKLERNGQRGDARNPEPRPTRGVAPRLETAQSPDFGDEALHLYRSLCADWPARPVPADYYRIAPAQRPVLLLSGGLDPATPPRHAARAAQALGAKALHVVAPKAGHGLLSTACGQDMLYRFVSEPDEASALRLDTRCAQQLPRPLFYRSPAPVLPHRVGSAPGSAPGAVGAHTPDTAGAYIARTRARPIAAPRKAQP
jgi:pimeloyl-ACP methyl ester carboxylesterase